MKKIKCEMCSKYITGETAVEEKDPLTGILEKKALEVKDIQNYMGIGKRQAYDLVKKGFFPAHKIGTVYRIPAKAFINWFNGVSE